MFQIIKENLERGAQKWDAEIERLLKLKVGAVCTVSQYLLLAI